MHYKQLRIIYVVFLFYHVVRGQIISFPYGENFDAVTVPALPVQWSVTGFTVSTSSPRSTPNCMYTTGNTSLKMITSPVVDFTNRFPDKLIFWERRSSTALLYRLEVCASTDGFNFNLVLARFDTSTSSTAYVQRVIDLHAFGLQQNSIVQFRWVLLKDSTNSTGALRIDDISLTTLTAYDVAILHCSVLPKSPTRTDSLTISTTIRNLGLLPATNFTIGFYLDANQNMIAERSELFYTFPIHSLDSGDSLYISAGHASVHTGLYRFFTIAFLSADENSINDTSNILVSIGNCTGDVLINEVLYAPAGDEGEWIELFNPTADTINLNHWKISDNNTAIKFPLITRDYFLPPESFVVIAKDMNFLALHQGISVLQTNFSALNNTTPDAVVLFDAVNSTIDSLHYEPSWGGQNGKSLERIDTHQPNSQNNWTTSEDSSGNTPGRTNSIARLDRDLMISRITYATELIDNNLIPVLYTSIMNCGRCPIDTIVLQIFVDANQNTIPEISECRSDSTLCHSLLPLDSLIIRIPLFELPSGESVLIVRILDPLDQRVRNNISSITIRRAYEPGVLVINEIMFDPLDNQNEWIELYNRSSTVVDVRNWSFSDRPTTSGTMNTYMLPLSNTVLSPKEYACIASDSSILNLFTFSLNDHLIILKRQNGFSFNNDSDAITLKDLRGTLIDSVLYSSRWHNPNVSDTHGRSLERINPEINSNDPHNWSTCTNILGGTPCKQNSIYTTVVANNAAVFISPNPFSPDGDGFEDFCIINFTFPMHTVTVTARIFDMKGRTIRMLANNEYHSGHDRLVWDGLDDNRQRARIGVYVLLLEATDMQSGKSIASKAAVVVGAKF